MFSNGTFYPTPENLASKMVAKINGHPVAILEPSAGKGDLVDAVNRVKYDRWSHADFSVIEKVQIPDDPGRPFHLIPASDSISFRPSIPFDPGH